MNESVFSGQSPKPQDKGQDPPGSEDDLSTFLLLRVGMGPTLDNEKNFKVKLTTRLRKLRQIYADFVGVPAQNLRFDFDSAVIQDEDTPLKLKMENDDVVHVFFLDRRQP